MYNEDGIQIGILPSIDGYLYKYNFLNSQMSDLYASDGADSSSSSTSSGASGGSVKFIDRLEKFPFDLRQVLSSSFKINDEIGFIGSVNILTLGIHAKTGHVSPHLNIESSAFLILIIIQLKHIYSSSTTARPTAAFTITTGS